MDESLRQVSNDTSRRRFTQHGIDHEFRIVSPNSAQQPYQGISPRQLRPVQARRRPRNRHLDSSLEVLLRICERCNIDKPITDFTGNSSSSNTNNVCNACHQETVSIYSLNSD
jgi:hypothetical protein